MDAEALKHFDLKARIHVGRHVTCWQRLALITLAGMGYKISCEVQQQKVGVFIRFVFLCCIIFCNHVNPIEWDTDSTLIKNEYGNHDSESLSPMLYINMGVDEFVVLNSSWVLISWALLLGLSSGETTGAQWWWANIEWNCSLGHNH